MKYLIYKLIILFFWILCSPLALGQNVFHTKAAQINIKVSHHGRISSFWADKLNILLDYSDASFVAKLQKVNIHSDDILPLNELGELSENEFELEGKFSMNYIETATHIPLQFAFSGTLSYMDYHLPVYGVGQLVHVDGGYVACLLSFKFILRGTMFPKDLFSKHPVEYIQVDVLQSVLKPEVN